MRWHYRPGTLRLKSWEVQYLHYKNLYGGEYKDYYTSSKDDTIGEGTFESESNSDRNDTVRNTYR